MIKSLRASAIMIASSITLSVMSQSAVNNTSIVSMCGCPGELWNFSMPYKPWVNFSSMDHSKRLMHTGYGFNVPATCSITGIQVEFDYTTNNAPSGTLKDSVVAILLGGNPNGQDKANETPFYGNSGHVTLGGQGDTWTMALTPAHINDPGFGFNIRFYSSTLGTVLTFQNGVTVTVYYVNAAGVSESQRSSGNVLAFAANRILSIGNLQNEEFDIELFDLTGKSVLKQKGDNNNKNISLADLPEGVYIYRLKTPTRSRTARIVID